MSAPELSLIVVGWETRAMTLRCVESARRALAAASECRGLASELIVVDNGSRDGSAQALSRLDGVQLVALPENRGFAGGVNAGLAHATGDLLAIVNSDAFLDGSALLRAVDHLRKCERPVLAGVQLRRPDGRLQRSVHAFPGLRSELRPSFLHRPRAPRSGASLPRPASAVREIEAPLGAVLFLHRPVLEAVGGLDEGYFFFLEETDWAWRAREAGFRVVQLADVEVEHLGGASSKRRDAIATRIEYHRSLYRFVRLRRGRVHGLLFVAVRQLRSVAALLAGALAAPFSARQRGRLRERAALLGWHLRGQPPGEGLRALAPPPEEATARAPEVRESLARLQHREPR